MRSKSIELKRKIYDFVNDWRRTNGKAPTIRCIADGLSIAKTTAQRYLVEMADEGWGLTYSSKGIETREMNAENMMLSKAMIVGSIPCGEATSEEQFVEEYVNLPVSIFGNGALAFQQPFSMFSNLMLSSPGERYLHFLALERIPAALQHL